MTEQEKGTQIASFQVAGYRREGQLDSMGVSTIVNGGMMANVEALAMAMNQEPVIRELVIMAMQAADLMHQVARVNKKSDHHEGGAETMPS